MDNRSPFPTIVESLTFDDVLLIPQYSNVLPREVSIASKLTRDLSINVPIVSAAMDTVTEFKLAIAMAREGGIGIIHKNMSIEDQADHVRKVKRSESGMIIDVMTKENLITAPVGTNLVQAEEILQNYKIEKLPVVDDSNTLMGLITYKDIIKVESHPNASKDSHGRLLVGAAVGVGSDTFDRVGALQEVGVDVVIVDTAHGHSQGVLTTIKEIKKNFKDLQIIGGNVATEDGAQALIDHGVDGIKVGVGPGSICTTRIIAGVGVPQLSAIMNAAKAGLKAGVPIIGDGGIRYTGDIAKAIAAGASCIMGGSLFAGTEEAPGETVIFDGRKFKVYRGMGSLGAMEKGSKDRYFQDAEDDVKKLVPEGIEGRVPYKGTVSEVMVQYVGGLKASMGYCGAQDIPSLQGKPMTKMTGAGIHESHPHNITITKESPNYSRRG
jgi:IMP dehydrogenase